MRRRRSQRRRPELTALIDVLFILLFAALVQARGSAERQVTAEVAAEVARARAALDPVRDPDIPPDAGPGPDAAGAPADAVAADADADAAPAPLRDTDHLRRSRALATSLARAMRGKNAYTVEVSAEGDLVAITPWADGVAGDRVIVNEPLVREADASEGDLSEYYRGEESESQRICAIVAARLAVPTAGLNQNVVMILTEVPFREYNYWIGKGMRTDVERCARMGVFAMLLDPPAPGADDPRGTDGLE